MDIIHQVQAHSGQAEIEDTVRILHERIDSRSTIRRLHRTVVWLGAAASLLLMLLVGSGIARYRETNRWISVTNPAGSPVKDFKLPDGTQVFLNEKSSFVWTARPGSTSIKTSSILSWSALQTVWPYGS